MEAVNVLVAADGGEDAVGVDVLGEGELYEDSVDCRVFVECDDLVEELLLGDGVLEVYAGVFVAYEVGCFVFAGDV